MTTDDSSVRRKRIALLSTETDVQRSAAGDRANSVTNKASFLVLAAGLLTGSALFQKDTGGGFIVASVLFALGAVIACVIALWPVNLSVIDPRKLKDKWIDADASDYELEVFLLQAKVQAYENQQTRTNERVLALKLGFICFAIAIGCAVIATIISAVS